MKRVWADRKTGRPPAGNNKLAIRISRGQKQTGEGLPR